MSIQLFTRHPFSIRIPFENSSSSISNTQKAAILVVSILTGLLTLGVLAPFVFFRLSYFYRQKLAERLTLFPTQGVVRRVHETAAETLNAESDESSCSHSTEASTSLFVPDSEFLNKWDEIKPSCLRRNPEELQNLIIRDPITVLSLYQSLLRDSEDILQISKNEKKAIRTALKVILESRGKEIFQNQLRQPISLEKARNLQSLLASFLSHQGLFTLICPEKTPIKIPLLYLKAASSGFLPWIEGSFKEAQEHKAIIDLEDYTAFALLKDWLENDPVTIPELSENDLFSLLNLAARYKLPQFAAQFLYQEPITIFDFAVKNQHEELAYQCFKTLRENFNQIEMTMEENGILEITIKEEFIEEARPFFDYLSHEACSLQAIFKIEDKWFQALARDQTPDVLFQKLALWLPLNKIWGLSFERGCQLTESLLLMLAEKCTGLKHLKIDCATEIYNGAISTLASKLPGLQSLSLLWCFKISDEAINSIAKYCTGLKMIDFTGTDIISDTAIINLAQKCHYLENVTLTSGEKVSEALIISFVGHCPRLKRFNLNLYYQVTDAAIRALAKACPALEELCLLMCSDISDRAISALAERCFNLKHLDLVRCKKITDQSISLLASQCHQLNYLSLDACENITDESIMKLGENCQELQFLSLAGCDKISSEAVAFLAKNCQSLKCLDLGWCYLVDDGAIYALANNCLYLEELDLRRCPNVTGKAIAFLAQKCPLLKRLCLFECVEITNEALEALEANCPGLQELNLYHCPKVTPEAISSIKIKLPNLKLTALAN